MTHAPRKVYTRKGDDGTTGLFHGGRIGKDAPGPAAYGDVDEAVSALGLARALTEPGTDLYELLLRLQRELFVAGAELATEPGKRDRLEPGVSRVTPEMVEIMIEDEGPGFERSSVPDPTDEVNIEKLTGRGILLIESYMSDVEWSKGGRRVRLVKKNPGTTRGAKSA
jgi:hypothetical protein